MSLMSELKSIPGILVFTDEARRYITRNKITFNDPNSINFVINNLSANDLANIVVADRLVNQLISNIEYSDNYSIYDVISFNTTDDMDSKIVTINAIANSPGTLSEVKDYLLAPIDSISNDNCKYFEVQFSANELLTIIVKPGFITYVNTVGKLGFIKELLHYLIHTKNLNSLYKSSVYKYYLTLIKLSTD
jgi:hypothetical protein